MRLQSLLSQAALLLSILPSASVAASWTFTEGSITVAPKGAGVGGGLKEQYVRPATLPPTSRSKFFRDDHLTMFEPYRLVPSKALSKPVKLGPADTLKVILTTQDGKTTKRPHQAFLLLQDSSKKLDISYPFSIKASGKAKVELTQKDLPPQFLRSSSPLSASIVIASFGSSEGYSSEAFPLALELDPNVPVPVSVKGVRYGKLPEIHHIFRADPKSPSIGISSLFLLFIIATFSPLIGTWGYLGGNIDHLSKALSDAPLAHALFVGSIFGIEAVLLLYYITWNLFQTLPVLLALGVVAFLSGSRALTEVQERRLAGIR
ncbi:hypothetical protein PV08_01374 [Exophiala spinifera]|uniref:Ribophorin II C-terminal domain-containing protein n=1 Tax=Exophiala spinifera TaxID=91928 RepID=A0A0D1YZP9_9EURO|nr:uncharacterized protein PV08_01374 [Exophiala spinifera]KIW20796.1 hypothetical protein PV08_01374 [Exophiala spinifera]